MLSEVGNGAVLKKHFSDNFMVLDLDRISATWTGGEVGGGVVSVGCLLSVGIKQSRCNPCMQLITFPGTLKYLNCRFLVLPSSFFFLLLIEVSILERFFFAIFCISYITGRNEMQLPWRKKVGILLLLPNISENYSWYLLGFFCSVTLCVKDFYLVSPMMKHSTRCR